MTDTHTPPQAPGGPSRPTPGDDGLHPLGAFSGRRWLTVLVSVLVAVLLVGGVGGVWLQRQVNPPGSPGAEVTVEIPEGSSTTRIGQILQQEGVITNAGVFRYYARFKGEGGFQAGRYTFRRNMSFGQAIDVLDRGPEVAFDRVTVPEGFTLDQIVERVGEVPRFDGAAFAAAVESGEVRSQYQPAEVTTLEGLLLPETYFVDETEDERALLQRMVSSLDAAAADLGYDRSQELVGLTPYETIIVASLIERETKVPEERAKVSRVIHNRLARGMRLQIDATVLYALGEHKTRVLFKDLEVQSPYNTYQVEGLPPTPIAVPGKAALEAALNPAEGEWLYYVVIDDDGSHAFADTAEGHQRNIAEAKRRGVR